MDFSALMVKMVIFTVLLITGYLASRKGFLSRDFAKSASWLLVNVFLVASIMNSVLSGRPDLPVRDLWFALVLLSLFMAGLYAIGTVCARLDPDRENAPQTLILMSAVNTLFIGLPVVQTLCGSEAVFYMGLSCIPFNLILYSYGVWYLKKGKGGEGGVNWKDILSPAFAASVLALLLFVLDIPMPRVVTELFSTVSSATIPISMIVIGATLGSVSLKDAFTEKKMYILAVVRLLLTPVLFCLLLRPFVHNQVLLITLAVIAGCPCGVVSTPLSIQYGYDPTYSSEAVMVTTAFSMVTIPALLYVLF